MVQPHCNFQCRCGKSFSHGKSFIQNFVDRFLNAEHSPALCLTFFASSLFLKITKPICFCLPDFYTVTCVCVVGLYFNLDIGKIKIGVKNCVQLEKFG